MMYTLLFISNEPRRPSMTHPNLMRWLTQYMEQLMKQNYDFICVKIIFWLGGRRLNSASCFVGLWTRGDRAPRLLNSGIICRWTVSFKIRPFYQWEPKFRLFYEDRGFITAFQRACRFKRRRAKCIHLTSDFKKIHFINPFNIAYPHTYVFQAVFSYNLFH